MDKFSQKTNDGTALNIAALKSLFPEVVSEGKVDFDALKTILGGEVTGDERYQFTWAGKRAAMLEASTSITKTLRPCIAESKDWETTKNIFIEGDNLDALKILQNTYGGKVKMIYIDPPYNTGHDFIYHDNFHGTKNEEAIKEGAVDAETGEQVKDSFKENPESNGYFHSDWCSMMYPRLKLARNLLTKDGVVVIHIDENEVTNLTTLCNEIFGEVNHLGTVTWDKRNPKGDAVGIAQQHEYILYFARDKREVQEADFFYRKKEHAAQMLSKAAQLIKANGGANEKARKEYREWVKAQKDLSGGERAYDLLDENGNVFRPVSMAAPDKPETRSHRPLIHPVTGGACPVPEKGWRFPDKTMDCLLVKGEVIFGKDETVQPQRKYLLKNNIWEQVPSLLYFGGSDNALGLPFDNPKPVKIAKQIIESICKEGEIVMDFFAGSATTGHAVMELNAEDGGERRYILVQFPEDCLDGSAAAKQGFKSIPQLSEKRLVLAGAKIKDENTLTTASLDVGFRVFKVDSSNLEDVFFRPADYQQDHLLEMINNVKTGRTGLDLLFGCLLEWGLPIDLPTKARTDLGTEVYDVGEGRILACFDMNVTEAVVRAIAADTPDFAIFRDLSFTSSADKINVAEIFKTLSPNTKVKVL